MAGAVVLSTGAYQRPHRPRGSGEPPARAPPDRRRGLPQSRRAAAGPGAGRRQRPVRLPDRRGAPRGGPRGPPRLRPRRVDAAPDRRSRRRSGGLRRRVTSTTPVDSLPNPPRGCAANVQATGHGGGHDLHYRTLQRMGVTLLGHFLGAEDGARALRSRPRRQRGLGRPAPRQGHGRLSQSWPPSAGLPWPELPEPEPIRRRDARARRAWPGFGAVVFAGGFRPDYESWVDCPGAFDELGFPIHDEGASTVVPGLHFVGVHFLRKRKSSLLIGVGEDAAIVRPDRLRGLGGDRGARRQLEALGRLGEDARASRASPARGSGRPGSRPRSGAWRAALPRERTAMSSRTFVSESAGSSETPTPAAIRP